MTHIDPFAPADSPQHPANWSPELTSEGTGEPSPEAMPHWIQLADEPVYSDNTDAAIIGDKRWEEYNVLLVQHGTDEQKAMWDRKTEDWDEEVMPTLAQLKEMHLKAQAEPPAPADEEPEPPADQDGEADDAEAELAAALAKLEGK